MDSNESQEALVKNLKQVTEKIKNFAAPWCKKLIRVAPLITALTAVIAVVYGVYNVNNTIDTNKHLKAMDMYISYAQRLEQESKDSNNYLNENFTFNEHNWNEDYMFFADFVLILSENIYRLRSDNDEWRKTLYKYMLYPHIPYYEKAELIDDAFCSEFRQFYADSVLYYYKKHRFQRFPDVQQSTDYTCGASAAQSILMYYGIFDSEKQVAEKFGTTEVSGTSPMSIIKGFKTYGLDPIIKERTTLNDLQLNINNHIPTMVALQAWLNTYPTLDWSNIWEDGHWVVVVGMDKDKIYFEDPSILGSKGWLTRTEFLARWHDYVGEIPCCDSLDILCEQLSITVKDKPLKKVAVVHID